MMGALTKSWRDAMNDIVDVHFPSGPLDPIAAAIALTGANNAPVA